MSFFFPNCCSGSSVLFDIFDHAGKVSKTAWKWKGSGSYIYIYIFSAEFEVGKL